MCYGDSNTYGYDPRSCLGGRYPENVRWTALLQTQGWDIFNAGQNGRSIPRNGWEIETLAQMLYRQQPDIVTVMLGSNDFLQEPALSAAGCGERMERFLAALLEQALPCRLLLIAPPSMVLGAWVDDPKIVETSRRLGSQYQGVAKKLNVAFADANAWGVELAYDGVHFSKCGHRAFFAGIGKRLSELAGDVS